MEGRRTFNTPVREPWNAPIHNTLKAIDNHMALYFSSRDKWHLEKAEMLRNYLHELKSWIHATEKRDLEALGESARGEGE
jgi:hypothetical protein